MRSFEEFVYARQLADDRNARFERVDERARRLGEGDRERIAIVHELNAILVVHVEDASVPTRSRILPYLRACYFITRNIHAHARRDNDAKRDSLPRHCLGDELGVDEPNG